MAAGINLRERPLSRYTAATDVFRTLIDLPQDVGVGLVALHAIPMDRDPT